MSKTYDLSLKGLFKNPPVNLLRLVLGIEIDPKKVKFLDVKLPKLVEREADLLMEYEGQIYHIEFQSTDDPRMALRMLHYTSASWKNTIKNPSKRLSMSVRNPLEE